MDDFSSPAASSSPSSPLSWRAALPATGTDTQGPLFLAFGLAFLGAGFVLLGEGSTRKLLRSH